jgi:asparagine synthase (glutamine-hydrolysing)
MSSVGAPELLEHVTHRAVERFSPYFAGDVPAEDAAARADLQALLYENLEVRVDIATMASGLEGRSPFLDHRFIEWAAAVPANQRMRGLRLKSLLKEALADRVPREVMYRPKQGFFMDFAFLNQREEMIRDTVLSPAAQNRGILDSTAVRRLIQRHYEGKDQRDAEVWMLFVLEQWFQMWIDPPVIPLESPATPRIDA